LKIRVRIEKERKTAAYCLLPLDNVCLMVS